MTKISLKLSSPSIYEAIRKLESYSKKLNEKEWEIRKETAKRLVQEAQTGFNNSGYDDTLDSGMRVPDVKVYISEHAGKKTQVTADGREAVFAEFGAGVYYNPGGSPHPSIPPEISPIGEYGKGYGKRRTWGFRDEDGILHLTHGTPASMPMYHAAQKVAKEVPDIAKKVFESGGE